MDTMSPPLDECHLLTHRPPTHTFPLIDIPTPLDPTDYLFTRIQTEEIFDKILRVSHMCWRHPTILIRYSLISCTRIPSIEEFGFVSPRPTFGYFFLNFLLFPDSFWLWTVQN